MENAFFALAARMRHIRRWGLMRNSYPENLLEHSHMTAVMAHALAVIRRDVFHRPADPEGAATAALYHDMSEILTGDMPTPVKYRNESIRTAYKAVERQAEESLLELLPPELRNAYEAPLRGGEGETHVLVKAADKLSAYIKCVEELRAGNTEFRSAEVQLRQALEASQLPEVAYFMERFLPSFGMTLDELSQG